MRLLLTNDDGIDAEGIITLRKVLSKEHEVFTVAPLSNKSGSSCSIKMYKKLELQKKDEKTYALDGTPTDCVVSAIKGNFVCGPFDAVLSGINQGANLGTDTIYSGTCGAARQAAVFGIPGIALSVESLVPNGGITAQGNLLYEPLAEFVLKNLEVLVSLCKKNQFLNINAPSITKFSGIKFCSLSFRDYGDKVSLISDDSEKKIYSVCEGGTLTTLGDDKNDSLWVSKGYIALSLLDIFPKIYEVEKDFAQKIKLN